MIEFCSNILSNILYQNSVINIKLKDSLNEILLCSPINQHCILIATKLIWKVYLKIKKREKNVNQVYN
jgi:hypothetical protein